ncbi:MAG: sugar-binding protein [Victivallaceae bacterium]|nr:sugar-binding protein [Victivallaceae bacterium]
MLKHFWTATVLAFAAVNLSLTAFELGSTTHFPQGMGEPQENMQVFHQGGMRSLRDDVTWGYFEQKKGVYTPERTWLGPALAQGNRPLLIFCNYNTLYSRGYPLTPEHRSAYAKAAAALASHYKGRVPYYQIWNEWDGGCGMGGHFPGEKDPNAYVALLAATYPEIKKANPDAVVISNSMTSLKFLEETFQAGVLKHCDGYAFHLYLFGHAGSGKYAENYYKIIKGVTEMARKYNNGKPKDLYLTETGWPSHSESGGAPESVVADSVARTLLLIRTIPEVKGLWWYEFQDEGHEPKPQGDNFGIVTADLTPKESYYVMRSIAPVVRDGVFLRRLKTGDQDLIALLFRMPDGQSVIAAWTPKENLRKQIILARNNAPREPLHLQIAGFEKIRRNWGFRQWSNAGNKQRDRKAEVNPDEFAFSVTTRPVLLYGRLEEATIAKVNPIPRPVFGGGGTTAGRGKLARIAPMGELGRWISFGGNRNYFRIGAMPAIRDAKDLDAKFRAAIVGDQLRVEVEVADDKHVQKYTPSEMWNGDNVQLAFASFRDGTIPVCGSEYSLGLTPKGPVVFRQSSEFGLDDEPTGAVLQAERTATTTRYELNLPLRELGITRVAPGSPIGFSIAVNENDDGNRKGFLSWGGGIGLYKNPQEYNWLLIPGGVTLPEQSPAKAQKPAATNKETKNAPADLGFSGSGKKNWRFEATKPATGNLTLLPGEGPDKKGAGLLKLFYPNRKGVAGIVRGIPGGAKAEYITLTFCNNSFQRITFRVIDSSGQTLQWAAPVTCSDQWQTVRFAFNDGHNRCKWGGANDGKVHGKVQIVCLYFEAAYLPEKCNSGEVQIGTISIL